MVRLGSTRPEAYIAHFLATAFLAGLFLTMAPRIARFFYPDVPGSPPPNPKTDTHEIE